MALLSVSVTLVAGTVSLIWDWSSDFTVIGYRVYWGGSTHNYTNSIEVGNTNQITITNLWPGTYWFSATSVDIAGNESAFSNETIYTVLDKGFVVTVEHAPTLKGPWLPYPNFIYVGPEVGTLELFRAVIKPTP